MSRSADHDARRQQARGWTRQFLEELPRQDRLVLILAADEGLTDAEIGLVLNLEERTVRRQRRVLSDRLRFTLGLLGGGR